MQSTQSAIPDHVPAELIDPDFPMVRGKYTEENPYQRIIPEACEGPDVIYVPDMAHSPKGPVGSWVLRRFKDIQAVYMDTEHFSSKDFSGIAKMIGENWSLLPAEFDPPEHAFYRQLLNPMFSPGAMAKMDDVVAKSARATIDEFGLKDKTECEFIHDFAFPFPVGVILDLLGLPRERMRDFQSWANMIIESGELETVKKGILNSTQYLREVMAERKNNLGDDLLSFAIKAEVDGRKLNEEELLGYAFNFFLGGLDTVTAHTGNIVRHLATNLDDQRYLRENPDKIKAAVEEFMRAYAAVTTYRTCKKEVVINGITMKPGDKVALVTTLAGRDRDVFDEPHTVKLDRNPRHMSFATGPHTCLGLHLARRELRIAIEEIFKVIPEFHLKSDASIRSQTGVIVQPRTLPLVWG